MNYSKFLILIFLSLSMNFQSVLAQRLCELVENHHVMDARIEGLKNPYDNGYQKTRYHHVLDKVIETFNPLFLAQSQELKILRDWSDGAVNAWAFRLGREAWLEVPGGMARYHLISEEGFLMTICHELGHLLGGSPHRLRISFEGQADYFAPMKCMENILSALEVKPSQFLEGSGNVCVGEFCQERLKGIKSLTSYYAFLEKVRPPTLATTSTTVVEQTLSGHPPAQCRFDTMIKALGCSDRDPFSYDNQVDGACRGELARPACWFSYLR